MVDEWGFLRNFALLRRERSAEIHDSTPYITNRMIYRFKLVNDEVSNFGREIEIDPDATFLDLRDAILDSVDYTHDEMDSFFICDEDWSRREEITHVDMGASSDKDTWLMGDTRISEFCEEEGQRLIFVFDYLTERSFFMELKEIITGRSSTKAVCTVKKGNPPAQNVNLSDFEKEVDAAAASAAAHDMDFDMDISMEDGYDAEDLAAFNDDLGEF